MLTATFTVFGKPETILNTNESAYVGSFFIDFYKMTDYNSSNLKYINLN